MEKRQEVAGIKPGNIELYLLKRRETLGETNFKLLWQFEDYLRGEGLSPWTIYTSTYKLAQSAFFLKSFNKDLSNPTPQLIRLFLSSMKYRDTIRRYGVVLKKFYKFMIECYDEGYEKIYKSFKVTTIATAMG